MHRRPGSTSSTDIRGPRDPPGNLFRGMLLAARWSLTSPVFLFFVLGTLVGASLYASLRTGDWHWFQRSGALAVAVGAVLSTQRALIAMLDGSVEYTRMRRPVERDESRNAEAAELRACVCGFLLVAMGTIIWAYGDLLGCLLAWNSVCLG